MKQPDVAEYWEQRFASGPALETVGFLSFGRLFNVWMYRVRRILFNGRMRKAFQRYGVRPEEAQVLDVGSGSGFYIDRWTELGVKALTGYDLTANAVNALSRKYPGISFERVDIGACDPSSEASKFDIVSCMDVLYHIVDDVKYAAALANMSLLLKPTGLLVFTENCLHRKSAVRSTFQTNRTLAEIASLLDDANLEIVSRQPVFVLMNAPVDSANVLLQTYWKVLRIIIGRINALGAVAGALLYYPELLLTQALHEGPSTEMLICRRKS